MDERLKNTITIALNTLNSITVSGQQNMSMLLGVIQLLNGILSEKGGEENAQNSQQ